MQKYIVGLIFELAVPVIEKILISIAEGLASKTESNIDDDIVRSLKSIIGIKE
jgi:hypothetical protein